MKIISYTVQISEPSSYTSFVIEGGDSNWTIGGQVWFSEKEMEVEESALESEDIRSKLVEYIGEDLVCQIEEILIKIY